MANLKKLFSKYADSKGIGKHTYPQEIIGVGKDSAPGVGVNKATMGALPGLEGFEPEVHPDAGVSKGDPYPVAKPQPDEASILEDIKAQIVDKYTGLKGQLGFSDLGMAGLGAGGLAAGGLGAYGIHKLLSDKDSKKREKAERMEKEEKEAACNLAFEFGKFVARAN